MNKLNQQISLQRNHRSKHSLTLSMPLSACALLALSLFPTAKGMLQAATDRGSRMVRECHARRFTWATHSLCLLNQISDTYEPAVKHHAYLLLTSAAQTFIMSSGLLCQFQSQQAAASRPTVSALPAQNQLAERAVTRWLTEKLQYVL